MLYVDTLLISITTRCPCFNLSGNIFLFLHPGYITIHHLPASQVVSPGSPRSWNRKLEIYNPSMSILVGKWMNIWGLTINT